MPTEWVDGEWVGVDAEDGGAVVVVGRLSQLEGLLALDEAETPDGNDAG